MTAGGDCGAGSGKRSLRRARLPRRRLAGLDHGQRGGQSLAPAPPAGCLQRRSARRGRGSRGREGRPGGPRPRTAGRWLLPACDPPKPAAAGWGQRGGASQPRPSHRLGAWTPGAAGTPRAPRPSARDRPSPGRAVRAALGLAAVLVAAERAGVAPLGVSRLLRPVPAAGTRGSAFAAHSLTHSRSTC